MRKITLVLVFLVISCARVSGQTYSTNFSLSENPISENGKWVNGKSVGLDWANVMTRQGLAIGRQSGGMGYDDSTALLTGNWEADQTAQATVYSINQDDTAYAEVELRLRSSLSAHRNTGYEINFRCSHTPKAYSEIVRWNGKLGDFTYLSRRSGAQYGVVNGDVVKATIIRNVITVYINGAQVAQATDGTYSSGNPGMGFFLSGAGARNGDCGFTSFTATASSPAPSAPIGPANRRSR
jgi:hypothetical protein